MDKPIVTDEYYTHPKRAIKNLKRRLLRAQADSAARQQSKQNVSTPIAKKSVFGEYGK